MIIEDEVKVKINGANYHYLKNLGYIFNTTNEIIEVKVKDLSKGSHSLITAVCDNCKSVKQIEYKKYLESFKNKNKYLCIHCCEEKRKITVKEKYNVDNISHSPEIKEKLKIINTNNSIERVKKIKNTNLKLYGVENTFQIEEVKEKIKKTNIEKYGFESAMQNQEIKRKLKIILMKNGFWNNEHEITEWKIYKQNVTKLTNRNKKILLENWDGYDYYDNEYIKNNFSVYKHYHKNYPTIDHKISIFYGYNNNLTPEIIADINNLCITKRKINSSKNSKTSQDYIDFLKN
jgi:hypothetical protein